MRGKERAPDLRTGVSDTSIEWVDICSASIVISQEGAKKVDEEEDAKE